MLSTNKTKPANIFGVMCADEDGKAAEAEAEVEWKDDGSLPLDGQGQLPFYLVDAHEEHSNPGSLYLFGKVRLLQPLGCFVSVLLYMTHR